MHCFFGQLLIITTLSSLKLHCLQDQGTQTLLLKRMSLSLLKYFKNHHAMLKIKHCSLKDMSLISHPLI